MKNKSTFLALAVGIAAGLLAFYLLFQKTSEIDKRTTPINVLTASRYIPAGSFLTADMVVNKTIPESYVSPSSIQKISEVSNLLTLVPISANEQIQSNKFGPSGNSLSFNLDKDHRAYTLSVNETTGVGDLLHPGNHVDVITKAVINKREVTAFVFQNVAVLATGQKLAQSEQKNSEGMETYSTVTLALTPEQSEILMYLEGQPLRLLLRAPNDDDIVAVSPKTATEVSEKLGRFVPTYKK